MPRPVYSIDAVDGGRGKRFHRRPLITAWGRASAGLQDIWQCNSTTGAGGSQRARELLLDGPRLPSEQGWLGSTSVV
jgi:hypothetical protein